MHEGHGALHLQHPHHHAVTLRRHALVQAQAQSGVLALEGGTGPRGVWLMAPGPFSSRGSPPTAISQAKVGHPPGVPLRASGP